MSVIKHLHVFTFGFNMIELLCRSAVVDLYMELCLSAMVYCTLCVWITYIENEYEFPVFIGRYSVALFVPDAFCSPPPQNSWGQGSRDQDPLQ